MLKLSTPIYSEGTRPKHSIVTGFFPGIKTYWFNKFAMFPRDMGQMIQNFIFPLAHCGTWGVPAADTPMIVGM